MATEIITGRDMTFTIDSDNYDAQATSATLTLDTTIVTLQTLDGKAYTTVDSQGSFAVEMIADYGAASSLCEALWTAASSAPNTPLLSCIHRNNGSSLVIRCSANLSVCRWHCTRCANSFTCILMRHNANSNI
jgi:hypothetical protein